MCALLQVFPTVDNVRNSLEGYMGKEKAVWVGKTVYVGKEKVIYVCVCVGGGGGEGDCEGGDKAM